MSLTVQKDLIQNGKLFTAYGDVTSDADADDTVSLIDLSADLDLTVGKGTYTLFKIRRLIATNHGGILSHARFFFAWDATTDHQIMSVSRSTGFDFDYKKILTAGLMNVKATGFTGDLNVGIDTSLSATTDDLLSFFIEGELYGAS